MRALFAGLTFLGAGLLFWSQPMLSKQVLPLLGGSPAVWNTSVFFFQLTLLGGYAWAHGLSRIRSTRLQVALQVGLGLIGLAFTMRIEVFSSQAPIQGLLAGLLLSAGVPFFLLSSSAPLFQRWFSRISDQDPYRLYVASNAGSFMALLLFPIAIEPLLPMESQRLVWRSTYAVYLAVLLVCGWFYVQRAGPTLPREEKAAQEPLTWQRRLRWLLLSAAPSSLSLGTTTYLTTDIAPVPLLWVIPLAIYLLTFVLAFGAKNGGAMPRLWPIFVALAMVQLYTMFVDRAQGMVPMVLLHLTVLFLAARLLHGELAADRPGAGRLTEFYLWMSAGGALGGLFNGVVAPVIFDSLVEYPLALLACLALAPVALASRKILVGAGVAGLVLLAGWFAFRYGTPASVEHAGKVALLLGAAAWLVAWRGRSWAVVPMLIGPFALAAITIGFENQSVWQERTYFGVYRIVDRRVEEQDYRLLFHGRIMHGKQVRSEEASERLRPISYYHPAGPAGDVFARLNATRPTVDVAIVGLGVGGLAGHARAGDRYVFYEIDPMVVQLARGAGLFSYLEDSPAEISTRVGDGRLLLAAEDRQFDLLVLDAFGSDGIPVHLLTEEALREAYLPRLKPEGAIFWHVSNRFLDVRKVVSGLAKKSGLRCWVGEQRHDVRTDFEQSSSIWVLLSKDGTAPESPHWSPCPDSDIVWTDSHSNLLQVFRAN